MTAEIRDYGANGMIVLYTDSQPVYGQLKNLKRALNEVPYYHEQKGVLRMVGVDLYFKKKYKSWLEEGIRIVTPSESIRFT